MSRPNGIIVWEGPSPVDGSPIALIITGLRRRSNNPKTGVMIQSFIIRTDIPPHEAVRTGADTAVCGECQLRSVASGGNGLCYVLVWQSPLQVYKAYHAGSYARMQSLDQIAHHITMSGRKLRAGSYGDPAMVPLWVWLPLFAAAGVGRTGYTQRWRKHPEWRGLLMASVFSASEAREATAAGWTPYRVKSAEEPRMPGEAQCPASEEAGHSVSCDGCPIPCNGEVQGAIIGRTINVHGASAARFTASA